MSRRLLRHLPSSSTSRPQHTGAASTASSPTSHRRLAYFRACVAASPSSLTGTRPMGVSAPATTPRLPFRCGLDTSEFSSTLEYSYFSPDTIRTRARARAIALARWSHPLRPGLLMVARPRRYVHLKASQKQSESVHVYQCRSKILDKATRPRNIKSACTRPNVRSSAAVGRARSQTRVDVPRD